MANDNDDYKVRPVEIPFDGEFYKRPFFAYGTFKKGQLNHSKIEEFIEDIDQDNIQYTLYMRDGRPVINEEDTEKFTNGEKIIFSKNRICAYQRISNTHPDSIYKWDTVELDDCTYNVLVAKKLKGAAVSRNDNGTYLDNYDAHNDSFFYKMPLFICNELRNLDYSDENVIFKIQMYYMLLWTAIGRYSKLKYHVSNREGNYINALANDKIYQQAFRIVDPDERDSVHAANNAREYIYNKKKPNHIINFYYTVRCNVTHMGKGPRDNFIAVTKSLGDLLKIFSIMIQTTFNDDGEHLQKIIDCINSLY